MQQMAALPAAMPLELWQTHFQKVTTWPATTPASAFATFHAAVFMNLRHSCAPVCQCHLMCKLGWGRSVAGMWRQEAACKFFCLLSG